MLHPCPSCARHVRVVEMQCPFCAAALPERAAPPARKVPRGLGRAALMAFGVAAATSLAACGSSEPEPETPAPVEPAPTDPGGGDTAGGEDPVDPAPAGPDDSGGDGDGAGPVA